MGDTLYLDANASEPLRPAAREAVIAGLDLVGNPASIHAAGRAARGRIEAARAVIAAHCGARAQDVVLLSGATEANALAISGLGGARAVLVGATEHEAVRAAAPGAGIVPVGRDGVIDLGALDRLLAGGSGALVCVMAANNETGVINPVEAVAAVCSRHGALLHVDAVQAVGRGVADFLRLGAASVAISAHKIGGPKGIGALVLTPEAAGALVPMLRGGGQERGRRGGTPNVPAILGFAAAIAAIDPGEIGRLAAMRDAIEAAAVAESAIVVGGGALRLGNTSCLALPGVSAETQLIALDLDQICVSAGAACSSGKMARSHVIDAMGWPELAACAIRVSLPWNAPDDAADRFIAAYRRMADRALRKRQGFSTSPALRPLGAELV